MCTKERWSDREKERERFGIFVTALNLLFLNLTYGADGAFSAMAFSSNSEWIIRTGTKYMSICFQLYKKKLWLTPRHLFYLRTHYILFPYQYTFLYKIYLVYNSIWMWYVFPYTATTQSNVYEWEFVYIHRSRRLKFLHTKSARRQRNMMSWWRFMWVKWLWANRTHRRTRRYLCQCMYTSWVNANR